jgi:hypothetical protein
MPLSKRLTKARRQTQGACVTLVNTRFSSCVTLLCIRNSVVENNEIDYIFIFNWKLNCDKPIRVDFCCASTQAVSLRVPISKAWVRLQVRPCGICGGKDDTGAGFLRVIWFSLAVIIPPNSPYSLNIVSQMLYSRY